MRNAAARFDDDLGYDAPRRPAAPRKPRANDGAGRGAAGKKRKAKRPRIDMTKVARWAAIGMGATMAVGIMVNALMLQKGHHPAPLFGSTTIAIKPAATPQPVPLPPVRAARAEASPPDDQAPAKPAKAAGRTATSEPGDAIGTLIAGGAPASARSDAKDAARSESKTVTGVQRALTKLGFKVPATGTAGPATRKAIEAFEKDHHLPVKGEVDRRLVKLLAAESKTRID